MAPRACPPTPALSGPGGRTAQLVAALASLATLTALVSLTASSSHDGSAWGEGGGATRHPQVARVLEERPWRRHVLQNAPPGARAIQPSEDAATESESRKEARRRLDLYRLPEEAANWTSLHPNLANGTAYWTKDDHACYKIIVGESIVKRHDPSRSPSERFCATENYELGAEGAELIGSFTSEGDTMQLYSAGDSTCDGSNYDDDYYYHRYTRVIQRPLTVCGEHVSAFLRSGERHEYVFRAPESGSYGFSTCNSTSLRDGYIRLYYLDGYTTDAAGDLTNLNYGSLSYSCDDCGSCGAEPSFTRYFSAQQEMVVELAAYGDNEQGEYDLFLSCPANVASAPFPLDIRESAPSSAPSLAPSALVRTIKLELFLDPALFTGSAAYVASLDYQCQYYFAVTVARNASFLPSNETLIMPVQPDPTLQPDMRPLHCRDSVRDTLNTGAPSILGYDSPDRAFLFEGIADQTLATFSSCKYSYSDNELFLDAIPRFYVFNTTDQGRNISELIAGPFYSSGCSSRRYGTQFTVILPRGFFAIVMEKDSSISAAYEFQVSCDAYFTATPTAFSSGPPSAAPGGVSSPSASPSPGDDPTMDPSSAMPAGATPASAAPASSPSIYRSMVPSMLPTSSVRPSIVPTPAPSFPMDPIILSVNVSVIQDDPVTAVVRMREAMFDDPSIRNGSQRISAQLVVVELSSLTAVLEFESFDWREDLTARFARARCAGISDASCTVQRLPPNRRGRRLAFEDSIDVKTVIELSDASSGPLLLDLQSDVFLNAMMEEGAVSFVDIQVASSNRTGELHVTGVVAADEDVVAATINNEIPDAIVEEDRGSSGESDGGATSPPLPAPTQSPTPPTSSASPPASSPAGDSSGSKASTRSVIIAATVSSVVSILVGVGLVVAYLAWTKRREYKNMDETRSTRLIRAWLADVEARHGNDVRLDEAMMPKPNPADEEGKGVELRNMGRTPAVQDKKEDEETEL